MSKDRVALSTAARLERRPRPPSALVGALQNRIHPTSGRLLAARPVNAVPKPAPQARQKAAEARKQAKADREVYAHVTARDGGVCRLCYCPDGVQRHHIRGRGFTTPADVVCLCQICHGMAHVGGGKLLVIAGNADQVGGLRVTWYVRNGGVLYQGWR